MVKNVHEEEITFFNTRWAISYLAGPLTREQIKKLTPQTKDEKKVEKIEKEKVSDLLPYPPQTEYQIRSLFETEANFKNKFYAPYLLAEGEIVFDEVKYSLSIREKFFAEVPLFEESFKIAVRKENADYSSEPIEDVMGYMSFFTKMNYTNINRLKKKIKNHIFSTQKLTLFLNKSLNLISDVGESEEDFRARCRETVEKMIDKEVEKLKDRYERKIERIQNRIEREKARIEELKEEYGSKKVEEYISIGETVLRLLLGSRSRRVLSTAARKRRIAEKVKSKIKEKELKISQFVEELEALKEELEDKIAEIEDSYYEMADDTDEYIVGLEKNDIVISEVSILWKLKEK